MYKQIKTILIILAFIPLSGFTAGKTGVDWVSGIITASGSQSISINDEGLPVDPETGIVISITSARNAAWEKAKEKAVSEAAILIANIPVDSGERINGLIETDPAARGRVMRVLHEYARFREKPSGYMEVSP